MGDDARWSWTASALVVVGIVACRPAPTPSVTAPAPAPQTARPSRPAADSAPWRTAPLANESRLTLHDLQEEVFDGNDGRVLAFTVDGVPHELWILPTVETGGDFSGARLFVGAERTLAAQVEREDSACELDGTRVSVSLTRVDVTAEPPVHILRIGCFLEDDPDPDIYEEITVAYRGDDPLWEHVDFGETPPLSLPDCGFIEVRQLDEDDVLWFLRRGDPACPVEDAEFREAESIALP